jgi:kynurenine formamidase
VGEGDILIYRVGRHERRIAKGRNAERLDGKTYLAGIYPDCLEWISERRVSLLGSDCAHDVLPSPFKEEQFPIHVGTQVYMGVQLLHNLQLDRLLETCTRLSRFEFFMSVQPLNIVGATASPVNPTAIF